MPLVFKFVYVSIAHHLSRKCNIPENAIFQSNKAGTPENAIFQNNKAGIAHIKSFELQNNPIGSLRLLFWFHR